MSEEKNEKKEIEFVYEYDPGYRVVAANGVWGGVTPRGDFRLDFFVESSALPERLTHELLPGKIGEELSRTPPDKRLISRRLQVGVLLSLKEVQLIADFLNERLKKVQQITEDK